MNNKQIKELALDLTVELTDVCDGITNRNVFVNQILKSCSSIGANASEANYAQSKADFINKLEISLKECYETEYWIEVLFKTGALTEDQYNYFKNKCGIIRRKLISAIKNTKN